MQADVPQRSTASDHASSTACHLAPRVSHGSRKKRGRRPRIFGRDHDRPCRSNRGLRVDDLKAAVAPSLSSPPSARLRSETCSDLRTLSRSRTFDFFDRTWSNTPAVTCWVYCFSSVRAAWTAAIGKAIASRDLTFSLPSVRSASPTCAVCRSSSGARGNRMKFHRSIQQFIKPDCDGGARARASGRRPSPRSRSNLKSLPRRSLAPSPP